MIWLTWRQHRAQLLVTAGLLLVLGGVLLVSGLQAVRYLSEHAPPGCPGPAASCGEVNSALAERYHAVYQLFGWLPLVAPGLVGAFWGAPLLGREHERGTTRLAWTQDVPPRRWLLAKLGLLAAVLAGAGLALSAVITWWRRVMYADAGASGFGNLGTFNLVGVAPAAWWVFAFALGVAAGAVLRRTLPAMAVVVAGVTLVMPVLLNASDHYAEPVRAVTTDYDALAGQDIRLVRQTWVTPAGAEAAAPPAGACPRGTDTGRSDQARRAYERCLFGKGYRLAVYHHPPSRFWRFQLTEAAILLLAATALASLALTTTRRRH
ncbi:transporter [Sphaerisporangium rufum]|uniref:Transporter n=1 Tax=Sphaerisporangium rufum TaxID=1381558 RepID=A0A919R2P0_9ACTN|nr:hypothetical protein [Sphaerisporangium rufum]GII78213.1 transporter [Sphaerisporangium rufum]